MNEYEAVSEPDDGGSPDFEPLTSERNAEIRQLINQHNDELVNYISRWVGSKSDARDIAQEAYARIFRLGDPSIVSHFRAYLFRAAKNIASNWNRSRRNLEKFVRKEAHGATEGDTRTPEQICIAQEELEAVKRAFQLLPPRTRMIIHLIKEDGLSYEEVGSKLGIKTHSVRRHVERTMELLLEAVSDESKVRVSR